MSHLNADSTAEVLPEIREGSFASYLRHLGWYGWAMLLRFALDAVACSLLVLAVGPLVPLLVAAPLPVLVATSHKLPFIVFFIFAMVRTLLSDYVAYRLGDHGVKYRVVYTPSEHKLFKWPLRLFRQITWPLRWLGCLLSRTLMSANHWLMLGLMFVLRLFAVPGTSVANPYVLAGARGVSLLQVTSVNVVATGGCITFCYLLGEAFTSWL